MNPRRTSLQFCGDVWIPRQMAKPLPLWLTQGLVLNLEGPVTSSNDPVAGKICLKTDPDALRVAFALGRPAAACLANNHSLDYGAAGLLDTWRHLDELGIPHFGAGTKDDRCNNPLVLPVGPMAVALLGYVCPSTHPIFAGDHQCGVAPISLDDIRVDVATARQRGSDRIVVCLHWGAEEVPLPKPRDIEVARAILELGVDLIVGHHAHCRQPIYVAGRQAVFFGLGNAMFPDFEYQAPGMRAAWSRQRWWNRRSTLVQYEPASREVAWISMTQESSALEVSKGPIGKGVVWRGLPNAAGGQEYSRAFAAATRWAVIRVALSRFLARPRVPSIDSIVYVVRLLLRGR